ncbi:MAG: hypothetical protein ACOCX5_00330 [Chloroflexota bacterium]
MAYLNAKEREKLEHDLAKMDFNRAKRKLRRMDRQSKLAMYRNVQTTGEWMTRYDLVGLGAKVTLIEDRVSGYDGQPDQRQAADFELVRVIVEPLPENRT